MARPAARQMSFADLELLRQGVRLEPLLQVICDFLDRQPALIERVRRDLVRGLKEPRKGRRGLTAPQVLRALVLMRLKNWDYRELRERIADGIMLRQFTDFYCEKVPKHDAFNRGFNRLTPATLKAINDLVVEAAVKLGLEDGSKLRVDTTVVESDIHHPTDGPEVDDEIETLWKADLQLARLGAAQDAIDIGCRLGKEIGAHRAIGEQATLGGKATGRVDGGHPVLLGEPKDRPDVGKRLGGTIRRPVSGSFATAAAIA